MLISCLQWEFPLKSFNWFSFIINRSKPMSVRQHNQLMRFVKAFSLFFCFGCIDIGKLCDEIFIWCGRLYDLLWLPPIVDLHQPFCVRRNFISFAALAYDIGSSHYCVQSAFSQTQRAISWPGNEWKMQANSLPSFFSFCAANSVNAVNAHTK